MSLKKLSKKELAKISSSSFVKPPEKYFPKEGESVATMKVSRATMKSGKGLFCKCNDPINHGNPNSKFKPSRLLSRLKSIGTLFLVVLSDNGLVGAPLNLKANSGFFDS